MLHHAGEKQALKAILREQVGEPYLGITSRLPVIQEFLESIHTSRLQY